MWSVRWLSRISYFGKHFCCWEQNSLHAFKCCGWSIPKHEMWQQHAEVHEVGLNSLIRPACETSVALWMICLGIIRSLYKHIRNWRSTFESRVRMLGLCVQNLACAKRRELPRLKSSSSTNSSSSSLADESESSIADATLSVSFPSSDSSLVSTVVADHLWLLHASGSNLPDFTECNTCNKRSIECPWRSRD